MARLKTEQSLKPYDELPLAGKLRRLHGLAVEALAHYALESPEITYHSLATNLLYRVTSASGERFMLRLAVPGWRTFQDLRSEALWLEALGRETPVPVPGIVPARSGEYVLPLRRPGIPHVWADCDPRRAWDAIVTFAVLRFFVRDAWTAERALGDPRGGGYRCLG